MIDFTQYGLLSTTQLENTEDIPARILAVHRERYVLICPHGEIYGHLKSSAYYNNPISDFPTVGDFVMVAYNPSGSSPILETLPRKTFFSRREPGPIPKDQAVAANFDYVFIMQSLNFDLNLKRLERYLTLAWQSGAEPVVVLTKTDLVTDGAERIAAIENICFGVQVLSVSAKTGYGIDTLAPFLVPGKTIVFLGSSGVGKSSLVNVLAGESLMTVNNIRENDSKGRHTTTHRQLLLLKSGVMIIDTPGMRELGMWDVSDGLGEAFSYVTDYLDKCKFSDCNHGSEPGCAIKEAIKSGVLSNERWESYLKIKQEAKFSDDKKGYLKEKQQWHKSIAGYSKQHKKMNRKNDSV